MTNKESPKLAPSFLVFLNLPNFNRCIRVPPFFTESYNYKQSLLGGQVILRTGGSDKTWAVKVEEDEGRYEFTRGWDVFARDVGLPFAETLICTLVSHSTFLVSTHCGELKAPQGKALDTTSFSVILEKHHKNFMNIPMRFAKETGIINQSYLSLRNEDGESRRVVVSTRPGRVGLRGAWIDYWEEHNLSVGNRVTFTKVGDSTLVVRREGSIAPRRSWPSKKRGRPRVYE